MITIALTTLLFVALALYGLMMIWQDDYQRENIKRDLDRKHGRL